MMCIEVETITRKGDYEKVRGFYWTDWTEGHIAKNVVEIGTCITAIRTLNEIKQGEL